MRGGLRTDQWALLATMLLSLLALVLTGQQAGATLVYIAVGLAVLALGWTGFAMRRSNHDDGIAGDIRTESEIKGATKRQQYVRERLVAWALKQAAALRAMAARADKRGAFIESEKTLPWDVYGSLHFELVERHELPTAFFDTFLIKGERVSDLTYSTESIRAAAALLESRAPKIMPWDIRQGGTIPEHLSVRDESE